MKLVIVESPHKAKTIEKFLGKEYAVEASGGHVRDLPSNFLGIDVKNDFEPKYVIIEGGKYDKKAVIKKLADKAKKAEIVYLATDPDREGEAISWHLKDVLNLPDTENRIEFNEISQRAVKEALAHPRKIDMNLVDAQQARRVLDRLVGYKLSPFLCDQVQDKLSAGRVQSVVLRLIIEREEEIKNFVPSEYWNISVDLKKAAVSADSKTSFRAQLVEFKGKKEKPSNENEARAVVNAVENSRFSVLKVKRAVSKSHAPAPFTTSTLQQDASSKFNLTSPQVMSIAQQLYEGVTVEGEGQVALVTYIRTDSVRISKEAQTAALEYIKEKYGDDYCPDKPNHYAAKKDVQDAHEAIRPITLERAPESLRGKVSAQIYKVYKLIYDRFVASQMAEARYDTLTVDIVAGKDAKFRATGKTLAFKGYTAAYESYDADARKENDDTQSSAKIPNLNDGDELNRVATNTEQKFTKPPLRYTDATLIKLMEEKGIGRPSTYASIVNVLLKREYTVKEQKFIKPTELAYKVNELLIKYFENIVDVKFTADMESNLDLIGAGKKEWKSVIEHFYPWLMRKLTEAKASFVEKSDVVCEKCGMPMVIRSGKNGKFLACSGFPECRNTRPLEEEKVVLSDRKCDICGNFYVIKRGKFGEYLRCDNCKVNKPMREVTLSDKVCSVCGARMEMRQGKFGDYLHCPTCMRNEAIVEYAGTCPDCGRSLVKRKSKMGKFFYGCTGYNEGCKFASWYEVADEKCPKCGAYMNIKRLKRGDELKCSSCDYVKKLAPSSDDGDREND